MATTKNLARSKSEGKRAASARPKATQDLLDERARVRALEAGKADDQKVNGESFDGWWEKRQETDRAELKLTRWSDRHPMRGHKSTGDWFLTMAGCSFGDAEPSLQLMTIFNAITSELEVMAQLELLKRGARQRLVQKSGDLDIEGVADDLYTPLSYLSQRCRALGEITSRILRANFVLKAAEVEK
jgi:hypothetical protein